MPFTVQELIKGRRKPVTVTLTDTAQKAVDLMIESDFSQLPVVDGDDRPRGMVTSDSIIRAHSSLNLPLKALRIRDAMAPKPREFKNGDDLFDMLEYVMDADAVFIIDGDGRLTGIVTTYDTTEYFRRRAEDTMLVEDIETTLRDQIRNAYSGPNGLDGSALSSAITEVARNRGGLRGRFKAALKKYGNAKGTGPVDEKLANDIFDANIADDPSNITFEKLNLSEYIQMVLHAEKWDSHFKAVFDIDRDGFKHMLDRVREIRNVLAHFRGEIDSTQRNHLRFCVEWLGRHPPPPPVAARSTDASSAPTASTQPEQPGDAAERARAEESAEDDSRYTPLANYLQAQSENKVDLTFAKIEELIGGQLPPYARKHNSWWANDSVGHVQSRQWLDSGWRMSNVSLSEEKVSFYRPSERTQAYLRFYDVLFGELEKSAPGLHKAAPALGLNWAIVRYVSQNGQRIGYLAFAFAHRGRFRVELYIDSGDQNKNKEIFDGLHAHKQAIEAVLGGVSWERLDEKRASRIAIYRAGNIDDKPDELAKLRAWGVENMARLNNVISPLLDGTHQ